MNDNTGEMPNPLNPNNNPLDANPADSQPLEKIVEEVQTVNTAPTEQPAADPMARPMEQAPVAEPIQPKKKKTGLIVAGIIAAVVAIGCGVAAAIIFAMNGGDPVEKAVAKIMSGEMPAYTALNGQITVTPSDESSVISNVTIGLDSKAATTSMLNDTKATVTANFVSGDAVDFSVEEVYGSNGDLFLKLENVGDALEGFAEAVENSASYQNTVDCIEDETGETICDDQFTTTTQNCEVDDVNCLSTYGSVDSSNTGLATTLGSLGGVIELIDGQWLRVSLDDLSSLSGSGVVSADNGMTCIAGVLSNYKNYSNSIVESYKKAPFISSTTEGVTLASKSGQPVRKIVLNNENYKGFANSMKDSAFMKDLMACSDEGANVETSADASFDNMPTMYVEVDKDFNFARLAFDAPIRGASTCDCVYADECDCGDESEEIAKLSVDVSMSYPDTINVAEPKEYTDLSTLLQQLFLNMYSTSGYNTDTVIAQ